MPENKPTSPDQMSLNERAFKVQLAPDIPLDLNSLRERCMQDVEAACRLLLKFQDRCTVELGNLQKSLEAGNAEEVTRLAHNLKSVAAFVGALSMRQIAMATEAAARAADLKRAADELASLRQEAQRCADYVPRAIQVLRGANHESSHR